MENILELLNSDNKSDIRYAIEQLQQFKSLESLNLIFDVLNRHHSVSILEIAKETLLTFAEYKDELITKSKPLIFSNEPKVRSFAIDICSYFDDIALYLDDILSNEDYNIRKYALDILIRQPNRNSFEKLKTLLNDSNSNVRNTAIEFLEFFIKFRDEIEILIVEILDKIDTNDLYSLASIYTAITNGIFISDSLILKCREKIAQSTNEFSKHYLYKIAIFIGDSELIDDARVNAKKINLSDDLEKIIKFDLKNGK